jgi:hypothetical protein
MTAELELQAHWRGIVESKDFAGVSAFADHLMELWPTLLREDAENFAETGYAPASGAVLDFTCDGWRFRVCQITEDTFRVEAMRTNSGERSRWKLFGSFPPPDQWDYDRVSAFVAWMCGFLNPVSPPAPAPSSSVVAFATP